MAPRAITTEQFVKKAQLLLTPEEFENYDYTETVYISSSTKVTIICKKHGPFTQIASNHLRGYKCNKCGEDNKREKIRIKKSEEFITKAKLIHNNKYDYSNMEYHHSEESINIICPKHGQFTQIASNHLQGSGCKKCYNDNRKSNTAEFIDKSNIVHNNKYTYTESVYNGTKNNIKIECPEHGPFIQNANNHLNQAKGCPKCAITYGITQEKIVDYLKSLGIKEIVVNDRLLLNGLELDIYLPEYKIAIEYNGLYWHSDVFKEDNYHNNKTNKCLSLGVQLIHIFEDEWVNKEKIVKSRLRNILNKIEKDRVIYARNCIIREITDNNIIRQFLDNNHIQGFIGSKHALGLYLKHNDKEYLVSLMTFGKLRKNLGYNSIDDGYELLRFCNVLNYNVVGGASKLLNYFEKYFSPKLIISYADRRWSVGNLYTKLNFEQSHISKPNFFYIKNQKRINRFNYRKDILVSKYNCSLNISARKFTKNILGLNRIYDSGTIVYKKQY